MELDGHAQSRTILLDHHRRGQRYRAVPGGVREPQCSPAGHHQPEHPEAGRALESRPTSRAGRHRGVEPGVPGLSTGQPGKRGNRRCRHRASERTHQCDQRHQRHHRAEDQRSRLAHSRAWSRPGNRPDQRGVVELREDGRRRASAYPQCDRGDHLCPLSVGDLTSVAHLRSGHDESAPVVSAHTGVDPTLAAGVRNPQLHGFNCQRQAHRRGSGVGRWSERARNCVGVTRLLEHHLGPSGGGLPRARRPRDCLGGGQRHAHDRASCAYWDVQYSRRRFRGRGRCSHRQHVNGDGQPGPSQPLAYLFVGQRTLQYRCLGHARGDHPRRRFGGVRGRATEHEPARDPV